MNLKLTMMTAALVTVLGISACSTPPLTAVSIVAA